MPQEPQSQQGVPRKMPMILRARKPIDLDDKKAKNMVKTNPSQKPISKIPKLKTKKQALLDYIKTMARVVLARASH